MRGGFILIFKHPKEISFYSQELSRRDFKLVVN